MKYKAIIFDMDGTIIDTSDIWTQATRDYIKSKNIDLTPEMELEISSKIHGLAMEKSCQIIKDVTNISDPLEKMILEKASIACSLYDKGIRFVDGFEEFFEKIKNLGYKTAIATSADSWTLSAAVSALKLNHYFGEHIYSIACVNNICKPSPDIYLYAAKQIKVEPKYCLAIEDSAHGINAARAAGMFCFGINTSRNLEQVKNADMIIEKYEDIDLTTI